MVFETPLIGEIIKHFRLSLCMSQAKLAEDICSRDYIIDVEANRKLPSLYIINGLSEKMGVNLLTEYNTILKHKDLDTHFKIEKLNDCFAERNFLKLIELVNEYESLPAFSDGEPFQYLMYSKAIIASSYEYEWEHSLSFSIAGLESKYPNKEYLYTKEKILSNIDLNLILHIAVNLSRCNKCSEADTLFSFLYKYLKKFLSNTHYFIEKNYHFSINLLSLVVYNQYLFTKKNDVSYIEVIEEAISRLKSFKSSNKMFELLLCLSNLYMQNEKIEVAYLKYEQGHYMGLLYLSEEELDKLESVIMSEDNKYRLTSQLEKSCHRHD